MFNPAKQAYNNLTIPKEGTKDKAQSSGGLLSRGKSTPKKETKLNERERVAKYVSEIRKARMDLKNGRTT